MLNRREALKKLGAGGAVAAGASVVLSSTAVAQTGSGPTIGDPPLPTASEGAGGIVGAVITLTLTAGAPSCSDGSTPSASYSWSNAMATNANGVFAAATVNSQSGNVIEFQPNPKQDTWGTADRYEVDVQVTWTCGATNRSFNYRVFTLNGTTGPTVEAVT